MEKRNKKKPSKRPIKKSNFKIGDLIKVKDITVLFEVTKRKTNIGIIASEPYIFVSTVCESTSLEDTAYMELEDWCYDIMFGDELVKMMPEDFLELLTIKEEE